MVAIYGGQIADTGGENSATSANTLVTANASANTKGSYTELITSTTYAASGLQMTARSSGTGDFLIDIAIGSAGSEIVVVPNILVSRQTQTWAWGPFIIPLAIPAGTRIAAACQSSTGGAAVGLAVSPFTSGVLARTGLQLCTTYGANTATSGGTSVDPGGSANTKGSYAQITSSTTAQINHLMVSVGNQANTAVTSAFWLFDIAIGAAASEIVIVPDQQVATHSVYDMPIPAAFHFPVSIPASTRIAMRMQSSTTDATDRKLDFVVHGFS